MLHLVGRLLRLRPSPAVARAPGLGALLVLLAAGGMPSGAQDAGPRFKSRVWSAKWIWTSGEASPRNAYAYFRKGIDLDAGDRDAVLHITADSRYQVFVNGQLVGRGPVRSDRRWLYYDTWEVGPHLRKGENAVAVLVHHYGESTFQYMRGRGGLLAELRGLGGRTLLQTDGTWRARRSAAWTGGRPRMSLQLGFNEVFDRREEPEGWNAAQFDDSGWDLASVIGSAGMEPWPNLTAREIPRMREERLKARSVLQVSEVTLPAPAQHVDLGALMQPREWAVAYLATEIVSPDRREVELKFGSDDALKVWLNGALVVSRLIDRGAAPDQESARVVLQAGANRVLAKVVQGHSAWEFYFRIAGSAEGLAQRRAAGVPGAESWSVAGPFTYPMDPTLRAGFDTAFPPEAGVDLSDRYRNTSGGEFGWRPTRPGERAPTHVSEIMASQVRRPADREMVRSAGRILGSGGEGARVRTEPGADVSFLVDFGREVTGYPRFRVRGARGGEILDMGYGEVLHDAKGGFLPQSSDAVGTLNPDRDGVHYADRYICRAGSQEFQTFDKRAFRYLQLDIRNAPEGVEVDDLGIVFSTYPVEYRGAFQCSDERLNRIWEIGRYTCQLNMEDGYTDCPWRERGQWWGDVRVEALINYYCFGDRKLIRQALRQKAQSLNDEGMTWGVYPTDWEGGRLPSFTLIWVSTLWETYLFTGDREIVRELYPAVRATLDRFFAPRVGPGGLLKDVPYWVFIDWAPVDDRGESGALNAFYYDALRAAAAMGKLLGEDSAAGYERRAAAVREAMNARLWDADAGVYRDSILPDGTLSGKITQQTNSLCVLFDIAPRERHEGILDAIHGGLPGGRVVEAGSPYFSFYLLAALYHAGRHGQALAYIRERWGRMLDWGATTWWEMWTPGASFCHGWSGGPTYNLGAEVLGVKPLRPGFAEVSVAPQWCDLRFASGIVPLGSGEVRVAWQRDERGKAAALRVEAPEGVPVEVTLPGAGEVVVNRRPRLPDGVTRLPDAPGVMRFRAAKGGTVLFELRER